MESPYSFSSPSASSTNHATSASTSMNGHDGSNLDQCDWDYLHVSVLRASLEETKTGNGCCYFHPYVILEMDHPAQRHRTSRAHAHKRSSQKHSKSRLLPPQRHTPSIDFTWPESNFKL